MNFSEQVGSCPCANREVTFKSPIGIPYRYPLTIPPPPQLLLLSSNLINTPTSAFRSQNMSCSCSRIVVVRHRGGVVPPPLSSRASTTTSVPRLASTSCVRRLPAKRSAIYAQVVPSNPFRLLHRQSAGFLKDGAQSQPSTISRRVVLTAPLGPLGVS